MDENKIERVANATARNYALDGYRLLDYEFNDISQLAVYQMQHNNGNELKIIGDLITKEINIYLNKKLNKTINL
jgi:hypothetical protein